MIKYCEYYQKFNMDIVCINKYNSDAQEYTVQQ
jgi:hypothetical protein